MKIKRTTLRKTTTRLELTAANIIDALQAHGLSVPDDATVSVRIPGGGDHSNMLLEVDAYAPLIVEFTNQEESQG